VDVETKPLHPSSTGNIGCYGPKNHVWLNIVATISGGTPVFFLLVHIHPPVSSSPQNACIFHCNVTVAGGWPAAGKTCVNWEITAEVCAKAFVVVHLCSLRLMQN